MERLQSSWGCRALRLSLIHIYIVRAEAPALILMDMNFTLSTTGEEGLTLLKQVKVFRPDVPVTVSYTHLDVYKRQVLDRLTKKPLQK